MNKSSRDSLSRLDHVGKGLGRLLHRDVAGSGFGGTEMKEMGSLDFGDTMMLIRIRNEVLSQRAKWLRKKEASRAANILRDIARLLAEHLDESQKPDPPGTDSAEQYFARLQRDRQTLLNIGFLIEGCSQTNGARNDRRIRICADVNDLDLARQRRREREQADWDERRAWLKEECPEAYFCLRDGSWRASSCEWPSSGR